MQTSNQAMFSGLLEFDPDLIGRATIAGPRYTCYPTTERFSRAFGYPDYLKAFASLRTRGGGKPLSG